jgi:acyl-CoA reductase-like NAD-dependent aldehyde dehydrogenase
VSTTTYDVINPATEEVVGQAPDDGPEDARAAAAAARAAFESWAATPAAERSRLLAAVADRLEARTKELIPLVIAETGATVSVGSRLQVPQAVARFREYSRRALADPQIPLRPTPIASTPLAPGGVMGGVAIRQPVGVVACISPYNFPLVNMAGKVAPALAAGCTVVMKPAPQDPLAIIELASACKDVGFPEGVINLVTGTSPDTAKALVDTEDVDMISFTGSTAVGEAIYEAGAKTMKRLLLELGGKGAAVVLDDADIGKAIMALASVWGFHSGQICTAPTRAVVHRSRYDELVAGLKAASSRMKVGPPTDPTTVVGPVISGAQRDRIESLIAAGRDEGAEVVVGGERPDVDGRGFYVSPTLLAACTNKMTPVREEIFGPVIAVVPVEDEEEAVAVANDSPYGLYDYVFSDDSDRAFRVAKRLRCGHVGVNTAQRNFEAPFGGFKMSGIGRDGGEFGLHAYTELQAVIIPG